MQVHPLLLPESLSNSKSQIFTSHFLLLLLLQHCPICRGGQPAKESVLFKDLRNVRGAVV